MNRSIKRPAIATAALALAALVPGIVWATIPDGAGDIHGCASTSAKSLRIIDLGSCKKHEIQVTWSQDAIDGQQGPEGPRGSPGPAGPKGDAGLTFATTVAAEVAEDPVIGGFFHELNCPSGTKALNGSFEWEEFLGSGPQANVESFPIGDDAWGFAVGADNTYKGLKMFIFLDCVYAT